MDIQEDRREGRERGMGGANKLSTEEALPPLPPLLPLHIWGPSMVSLPNISPPLMQDILGRV
jgi:hypothetical protein